MLRAFLPQDLCQSGCLRLPWLFCSVPWALGRGMSAWGVWMELITLGEQGVHQNRLPPWCWSPKEFSSYFSFQCMTKPITIKKKKKNSAVSPSRFHSPKSRHFIPETIGLFQCQVQNPLPPALGKVMFLFLWFLLYSMQ